MLIKLNIKKGKMKITKTEEEKEKKQVIKEIEKKISNRVFANIVIAIIIMVYFCGMSIVYKNIGYFLTINIVKWVTLGFLGIAIILMEIAYKKESKIWAIHALEILALAVHSLTTTHITKVYSFDFQKYILWSSYAFSIYYVLKTIIINTKARKDYLRSLSDISQIVQKDEPQKKEATKKEKTVEEEKKVKEHKFLNKKAKEENKEISEEKDIKADVVKKEPEQEKSVGKVEENVEKENRRATRNKKLAGLLEKLEKMDIKEDKENSIETKKEEQPKEETKQEAEAKPEVKDKEEQEAVVEEKKETKKTTTKKTTTKKTTTAKKTTTKTTSKSKETVSKEENVDTENKPKKRGRPKKEVKVDD